MADDSDDLPDWLMPTDGNLRGGHAFKRVSKRRRALLEAKRSEIAELARMLEDYRPVSLVELVEGCPEDHLEAAEERLAEGDPTKIRPPEAELKKEEDVPEGFRWVKSRSINVPTLYGFVRQVLRVHGRELIREELKKFAERVDKYYVLVPKNGDGPKKETP